MSLEFRAMGQALARIARAQPHIAAFVATAR
jgi:hypothetical protein